MVGFGRAIGAALPRAASSMRNVEARPVASYGRSVYRNGHGLFCGQFHIFEPLRPLDLAGGHRQRRHCVVAATLRAATGGGRTVVKRRDPCQRGLLRFSRLARKIPRSHEGFRLSNGSGCWTRTSDPLINSQRVGGPSGKRPGRPNFERSKILL